MGKKPLEKHGITIPKPQQSKVQALSASNKTAACAGSRLANALSGGPDRGRNWSHHGSMGDHGCQKYGKNMEKHGKTRIQMGILECQPPLFAKIVDVDVKFPRPWAPWHVVATAPRRKTGGCPGRITWQVRSSWSPVRSIKTSPAISGNHFGEHQISRSPGAVGTCLNVCKHSRRQWASNSRP